MSVLQFWVMGRRRWRIAELLNRLPFMCWADLVSFALGHRRSPWQPIDSVCRSDRRLNGACFCGKIGTLR